MNKLKNKPKVFCIGWHKTGTTTLGEALLILGYKVVGARLDLAESLLKGDKAKAIDLAEEFEAFQDVPWAALFKELDRAYPGSKFIVTLRDPDRWLFSASEHFGSQFIELHKWLYGEGVLKGNEQIYLQRFKEHYAEIEEYFSGREKDVLYLTFKEERPWENLCAFLEVPVPKKSFPHANKGEHSLSNSEKIYNRMRSWIPTAWRRRILRTLGFPDKRNRFNNLINKEFHSEQKEF